MIHAVPEMQAVAMHELAAHAALQVDLTNDIVVSASSAAADLLAYDRSSLDGAMWHRVLPTDRQTFAGLKRALLARAPVSVPPFVLSSTEGHETILSAVVLPPIDQSQIASLVLWPVSSAMFNAIEPPPTVGDTIAVLGVDRIRTRGKSPEAESLALLGSLRKNTVEVVRALDSVSPVLGTSIVVLLRDIDTAGASDICRALLSHLHLGLRQEESETFTARLRIGLAHVSAQRSAQAAFLAADRAMLQSRVSWESHQVRTEDPQDFLYLVTDSVLRTTIYDTDLKGQSLQSAEETHPAAAMPLNVQPIDADVSGYVVDNMEGAVDQAMFLGRLDMPVAIIGPAGTGKMYVARILHDAGSGGAQSMVSIDCRELKGRKQAEARVSRELARGEGKTLVFKSPHLMHADAQVKLARQISSRTLADVSPARALANMRFVALFPHQLSLLVRRGELTQALASAFAGLPIHVPPIKDRKQAVLRWAHKILSQESAALDRPMRGFTADAEQAMLLYDWPGNISEMRECIRAALSKTSKSWLTPVDLGLFEGIDPEGSHYVPESQPFLVVAQSNNQSAAGVGPSALESLDVALGQAVRAVLELDTLKPIGTWLDDELVVASLDRYRGDVPKAGKFLQTKPRNVSRWLPKLESREEERSNSALWQTPRRLVREWVREAAPTDDSPMQMLQRKLLTHVEAQAGGLSAAKRANILGVSTPTYLKRLKEQN